MFGPYLAFANVLGFINAQKLSDDISDSLQGTCHKIDDEQYECTSRVNLVMQLVPTLNSRFVVEAARGCPRGWCCRVAWPILASCSWAASATSSPAVWLGEPRSLHRHRQNNFHIGNEATIFVAYTPPAKEQY